MSAPEVLQKEHDLLMFSALFDHPKENNPKSRGLAIEKRIEYLESLTGTFLFQVSNRRSRRWLNDRLLMELVPRLNAQEIRGLFAPPPWGEDVPPSPFSMTDVGEWDKFRNIDMDKEECIRAFVNESGDGDGDRDGDLLILHVQDPFHRLLLHGVCEFYNLVSVTHTQTKGKESVKTTKIKKKKGASVELPNITLCQFLRMAKEGIW
ncbi:uncharacterized protein LOC127786658 isoform X3 [Diospyros lotus]|uniref:uncharacterized protein LOC127786658 isoform X3 n=1 Tax=Diospyros lotus TaxID=55363 RepID=UPI0022542718|nr:uncharacterized protein LOC127786658 isoform X3 [Diospyros lotus]